MKIITFPKQIFFSLKIKWLNANFGFVEFFGRSRDGYYGGYKGLSMQQCPDGSKFESIFSYVGRKTKRSVA